MESSKALFYLSWAVRLIAAGILLQTLFFKFTGAEESKHIFRLLGAEPAGRIISGVFELLAVILMLIPRTTAIGSLLAMGVMTGAILAHLTVLGISVMNDGGLLLALAVTVFVCSAINVFLHRRELPVVGAWF